MCTWVTNVEIIRGQYQWNNSIGGYIAGHQFTTNVNLLNKDDSPRPAMTWLQNYIKENPRN